MAEVRKIETSKRVKHGDNSTWSSRGSEGHDWSGQEEEEESQEGYLENQSSYLGYNGMGHHDNEGISGMEKERKDQAKGSASNSKVTATHAACGVTKQSIARHRAKERTTQDGIMATKAKD